MDKFICVPRNIKQIQDLYDLGYTNFEIPMKNYTLRFQDNYNNINQIIKIKEKLPNIKIFINANKIFHDSDFTSFDKEFKKIVNITNLLTISDLGLFYFLQEKYPNLKLNFDSETTLTNSSQINFYIENGFYSNSIAREINLNQIKEITSKINSKLILLVHGSIIMFYSKRNLMNNFKNHLKKDIKTKSNVLYDKERDNNYQIFDNELGTIILAPNKLSMIDEIDKLEQIYDNFYYKIDSFADDEQTFLKVCELFSKQDKNSFEQIKELYNTKNIKIDKGFYYKISTYITK